MSTCQSEHRHYPEFEQLPHDQGGMGRHKCCGCAYERGYELGLVREEMLNIDIDSIEKLEKELGKKISEVLNEASAKCDAIVKQAEKDGNAILASYGGRVIIKHNMKYNILEKKR